MKTKLNFLVAGVFLATVSAGVGQPVILTPPQSQTNLVGTTATFTVVATGTPPLAYQWQRDTGSLDFSGVVGATNVTLVLANVAASDGVDYRVVVTNVQGAVTSAVATLTVLVPPAKLSMPRLGELHIQSAKGMAYLVESSPDLVAWTPLALVTNLNQQGGIQWTDPGAPGQNARFYRVVNTAELGKIVTLPAGSKDALATAITSAGPGGMVLVEGGVHQESGEVLVTQSVAIVGEAGAVLECETTPSPGLSTTSPTVSPVQLQATIHVKGTHDVTVRGLSFRPPAGGTANCAVLVEDSPHVWVDRNQITDFQFGVVIQRGDYAEISYNTIASTTRWRNPTDPITWVDGIDVMNGRSARVVRNVITGAVNGFMGCAEDGELTGNTVSGCFAGIQFCKVQDGWFIISGRTDGGRPGGTSWWAVDNVSNGNDWFGYVLTDGSNHNVLINNAASGNGLEDIILLGDTTIWAPLPSWTPATHDNVVVAGSHPGLTVKDCGNNDVILGDVKLVDTSKEPCQ